MFVSTQLNNQICKHLEYTFPWVSSITWIIDGESYNLALCPYLELKLSIYVGSDAITEQIKVELIDSSNRSHDFEKSTQWEQETDVIGLLAVALKAYKKIIGAYPRKDRLFKQYIVDTDFIINTKQNTIIYKNWTLWVSPYRNSIFIEHLKKWLHFDVWPYTKYLTNPSWSLDSTITDQEIVPF